MKKKRLGKLDIDLQLTKTNLSLTCSNNLQKVGDSRFPFCFSSSVCFYFFRSFPSQNGKVPQTFAQDERMFSLCCPSESYQVEGIGFRHARVRYEPPQLVPRLFRSRITIKATKIQKCIFKQILKIQNFNFNSFYFKFYKFQ